MSEAPPSTDSEGLSTTAGIVREHCPNDVTEGVFDIDPKRSTQRTRVKCDGETCDFYAEDPSWFVALAAHGAHLTQVLESFLAERVEGNDRMHRALQQAKDRQLLRLERRLAAVETLLSEWEAAHTHLGIERGHYGPSSSSLRAALEDPLSRPAERECAPCLCDKGDEPHCTCSDLHYRPGAEASQ